MRNFRSPFSRSSESPRSRRAARQPSLEILESRELLALTLQVDYSLDKSGFFQNTSRRTLLEGTLGAIVAPWRHARCRALEHLYVPVRVRQGALR